MFLDSHLLLHSIDALLVPRTEIVRQFRDSALAFTKCGNPFKIVGKAAKPEVCVCVSERERERERERELCAYVFLDLETRILCSGSQADG